MTGSPLLRPLGILLRPLLGLLLVIGLGFGLSGCVTTGLPIAATSPWQPVALATKANPSMWPSPITAMAFWWAATG